MVDEQPHILSCLLGKIVVVDGGFIFGRCYSGGVQGRVLALWSGRDGVQLLVQPDGLGEYGCDFSGDNMFDVWAKDCRVVQPEDLTDPYRKRCGTETPTD